MNITKKQVMSLINELKQIEVYRGEAYQNDDDIGYAMQNIKALISTVCHGEAIEVCPHCDSEQEISTVNDPCPKCGKTLIACSLCNMEYKGGCGGCPDGTSKNFDMDWFQIEPVNPDDE